MASDSPATILVVDDNPTNLQVASDHLSQYAYTVLTARDAETGLKRARYTQPDLILLDIGMPGVDGFEACRRLKAHPDTRDIPVLFMTAYVDVEDKLRAFELGGADYVTKPFEAAELLARVRVHLTLRDRERRLTAQGAELDRRVEEATERYRREAERLQRSLAERDRLLELVEMQAQQLRALTTTWMEERSRQDADIGRYLRTELTERLRLVAGQITQAALQVAEGPGAAELAQATRLLEPALNDSERLGAQLIEDVHRETDPLLRLSTREYEVFGMLVAGRSNKEIAAALSLKPTTISTFRHRILTKLGVDDVPALVRLSLRFRDPRERPPEDP